MDRFRQVAGVLAACGLAATGCTTSQQQSFKKSVSEAFVPAPPPAAVASHFECMWNNRIMHLPDPSKNGSSGAGLAAQGLLYGADMKPVEVNGDLTVTVHDATTRPPGQPAMRSEVWHFTKDTVKNMVSTDERYGRSIILFVPWPETWRDVNRVYIQARYDQPGGNVLYCKAATVTLDMNAPAGAGAPSTAQFMPTVPDPALLLRQARAAWATPPQPATPPQYQSVTAGVMPPQQQFAPPGYTMPPPATVQPVGYVPYPTTTTAGYPVQPPPQGYYQPPPGQGYQPPQPPPGMPVGYQPPVQPPAMPVLPPTPTQGYGPPPQAPPPGAIPIFQPPATPPPDRIVIPRG